jgi:putative membrane protein
MTSRLVSAAYTGLAAALVAAAPAGAQMRVAKDVPPPPAAAPAAPASAAAPMTDAAPAAAATPAAPNAVAPAAGAESVQTALAPAAPAAPAAAPAAAAPPRAPGAGETPEEMFTDARIAAVASISNFNEIDPSQIALERALAPALKDYARLMIDHHTRLEQSMRAMLGRKGVKPEDNALSLQLKRNAPPTLEMLRAKAGREFDVAYTLQQIQSHQTTLQTLDTSLIPSARDPEMKAMLRDTVRPLVADHLVRILAIHSQVMGAAPAAGQ